MQARTIILARVSSKAQEDEGYSLDAQIKFLREYCAGKDLTVVKEFKLTETASKQERRTVFHELLVYVAKHKIYHFVVEKTDRFTRNLKDAAYINDWLEDDGLRMLHVVKENQVLHKASRSDAKFMWNINLALAKKYTDSLREEAMKGWAEKLAQGWLPSPPPPGYKTITENGKRIHVPNLDTTSLMQRVFILVKDFDYSGAAAMREMTAMGLVTGKGRPFSKSFVLKTLRNPFYIGINRFNGADYPGAQEPIITKEVFEAVQLKLGQHKPRTRKHNPVFKGMIRCTGCGGMVTWQLQKGRYYGLCQQRKGVCRGNRFLREDRLERRVIGMLEGLDDSDGKILAWLEKALEAGRPKSLDWVGVIDTLQRQLTRLKRMDEMLYEDKLAGEVSVEKYAMKHAELTERMTSVQERLGEVQGSQGGGESVAVPACDSVNPIVRLYVRSTPDEKRVIMRALFRPLSSDRDGAGIEFM
ncbi:MAG TPA: recombinase family protein [Candidatus Saccharimonadia bacterium]|nr:recombinase family protein [Candidatus Saccharimonadia bacterium]